MTDAFRDHLSLFSSALTLREQRGAMLASNIANAATPGFKARDMDFQSVLNAETGGGALATSDTRHFATSGSTAGQAGYRVPVNPSLDGNTVELAVEQMEFAENSLRYQTSLTLLNRRISGLSQAIKGE
ncbi:MAG: flagellar basal body rod protein FlgB [Roseovarius sp. BRH_c41]|jgi:flagellar basal-body rod protein FlgB|uniref:flagellar basal body rod protein FlgB n=1 Tax=Roseovarius sp. BRH_c41 TaxID=1629709 RepID=UPI0005F22DB2|nr:flagellar basal body rod protein FlgB [Roseovarius sp. BRH_c41]KJS44150.1 MAG: flagellar basal body rod protein FlgB [Roseovarius sp. BRH_c41]